MVVRPSGPNTVATDKDAGCRVLLKACWIFRAWSSAAMGTAAEAGELGGGLKPK